MWTKPCPFSKALDIKPGFAEAHLNPRQRPSPKGKLTKPSSISKGTLDIKPDFLAAQNNLAWLLATTPQVSVRNGSRAVELAQRADQFSGGKNPIILGTLAAAYAEAGRFGDAQQIARKAVELARATGQQGLVEELTGELKLYRQDCHSIRKADDRQIGKEPLP